MKSTSMHGVMTRRRPGWAPLTLEEVADVCGLHPFMVKHFVSLGLVEPLDCESKRFAPEATGRLQRALRLRRDLGLNYNGTALVLELLDRIEALERRLNSYERQAGSDR